MPVIATIALAAVSTGIQIYGQQQQAATQKRAAEYNNTLAQQEATNRELESAEAVKRQQIQERKQMGMIRAQLANAGTLTTTGTPLAILGDAKANMDVGIQDAARQANIQAASYRSRGQMGLWEAEQAQSAADINSLSSGIHGITSAFGSYSDSVYSGQTPDTYGIYRTKKSYSSF